MRRWKIFLALVAMVLVFAGCGQTNSQTGEQTRTITDSYGRQVEIPQEIDKVAALGSSARLLTYAGCSDQLAGVTRMDQTPDPAMPYATVNKEQFASLTLVGEGGSNDVNYEEELVALAPDVIFSNQTKDMVEEVQQKTGIPVIGLQYTGIFDESLYGALTLTGQVMGTEEHCQQVVQGLKGWQQDLAERTKDIPQDQRPTVYTGGVSYKGPHGFDGTYCQYPPFLAVNANNVADGLGKSGALTVDREQILSWDPEVIFINPVNLSLVEEDWEKNPGFYESLSAVKQGKVYAQISYNYNGTNVELAVADAYYAGKVLYPEAFADVDMTSKAEEIFQLLLGQPYLETLQVAGLDFAPVTIGE